MTKKECTKKKLTNYHKHLILQLIAAFESDRFIVGHLQSDYGIQVTQQNINWYRHNREEEIEAEREKFRRDLMAIPLANKFYRIRERQKLLDDLKENLWMDIPLIRDGKAILDENGNPKVVKQRGNHSLINQLLVSTARELEPLRLDESNEKYDAPSLTHEEITRRMVAILDSWLIQKAKELGEPEPTVEERAKLIVEFIDLKKNRGAQDIAR